jgi:uncharacterized protein DUF87
MSDYEKLGVFYLGRPYDPATKTAVPAPLLYESKDLVTHAVCVGMTGSGKTGLCLGLLEEAAIDGIPAIVIDPKGDLSNLLLTFPALTADEFAPWINQDDARTNGVSPADFASQQAGKWKQGLAQWDQDGQRIRKLKEAADFVIYTPGSDAGLPVSIVKSFAAPDAAIRDDRELLRDRISATATSLLGLVGIEADPIKSREHVLLSTLLDTAWEKGADLDLASLIAQIQKPPLSKVGVMDLESFYPAKERFELAMALNNLLASPGFEAWLNGEPLDIDHFLHTPQGKPRVSIFSIAHLSDAERMFFVSLLLNQMLSWVRVQSGTTSLRAILYMDEIFGYFPPVSNPPSKRPLLTLLKQARAFGLGVVLATQNPVDLDYKGLANAGTWFIGRLQTERDKNRVLDGLAGVAGESGSEFDRGAMEQLLASLASRVFLMNNVHEHAPQLIESRWTLCYLRGPLARNQIKLLMDGRRPAQPEAAPAKAPAAAAPAAPAEAPGASARAPVLPPEIEQHYVPVETPGAKVVYQPRLVAAAQLHFLDPRNSIDTTRDPVFLVPITGDAVAVNWDDAVEASISVKDLEASPAEGALFADLPPAAAKARNYAAWEKGFGAWLLRTQTLDLLRSPSLGVVSEPGEAERAFRIRLQQAAREERDRQAQLLREQYAPKKAAIEEKIRRCQMAVEKEQQQSSSQKLQSAMSIGASLLGAFLGRKTISAANINRAATAVRAAGRIQRESQDVGRAEENLAAAQQEMADLDAQFTQETAQLATRIDPATEELEAVSVKLKKANIAVQLVALAWTP